MSKKIAFFVAAKSRRKMAFGLANVEMKKESPEK
jgi:hypothetical protein